MHSQILIAASLYAAVAIAAPCETSTARCPIVFDGRIPINTELTAFDEDNDFFDSQNVLGVGLKFSELLGFPEINGSRFDGEEFKPLEVSINDNSIFNNQTGFRRTGLLFKGNNGKEGDPSIVGVKTLHWSVKQNPQRAFNRSHEYLTVFHETADFSGNQFNFLAGTLIAGVPEGATENDPDTWKILDRTNREIFSTAIDETEWQNFAVTMDFEQNTLQVFTSTGTEPLTPASEPVANDNSGGGQFQIGILKKPTDAQDVAKDGFQEAGIDESQIYGGIFVEDSADECISL